MSPDSPSLSPKSGTKELPISQQQQQQPERIPPLNCVAAAMFVPLSPDLQLLTPLPSAPHSITTHQDRQRAHLKVIDAHEARVRSNLVTLFRREFLRIQRDGEAQEASFAYPAEGEAFLDWSSEDALWGEASSMVECMTAPAEAGVDYNIQEVPLPSFESVVPASNPREWMAVELMKAASSASSNIWGFDKHLASMREAVMARKDSDRDAAE